MQAMESIVSIILILVLLELFEAWWQRAETLFDVLAQGYRYYQKSIFLFLLMHPTFYYILFVILVTKVFNGWMVAILLLKMVDIFFKLTLMNKIFVKRTIDETLEMVLSEPLSPWLFLTGASLYPFLLFYALTPIG